MDESKVDTSLKPEFLGISATNSFTNYDTASRSVMYASHLSQCLVLKNSDEKIIQSGLEKELGRFTFSKKFPTDAKVISTIPRYRTGIDKYSINKVVDAIIIYEDIGDRNKVSYDVIDLPSISDNHQYFGFEYQWNKEILKDIDREGTIIPKDTIIANSPGVKENGGYGFGLNANVAMMTINDVTEDAMVVSDEFIKRSGFKIFERRTVEFGENSYLLNLYGDDEHYKPFPEIGEYIHESGAVCVKRVKSDLLAPGLMSTCDTQEFNTMFDEPAFVRNKHGIVKDIKVYRENKPKHRPVSNTSEMVDKYANAYIDYCQSIINAYEHLKKIHFEKYRDNDVVLSPELTRLITEATIIIASDSNVKPPIHKLSRKEDMDMYTIEFVIEYDLLQGVGYKMTGSHGDKAVICHVRSAEDMPVDEEGVRSDIITCPQSGIHRMNEGRMYENYLAKASRTAKKIITEEVLSNGPQDGSSPVAVLSELHGKDVDKIFDTAIDFLHHFNNSLYRAYRSVNDTEYKRELLQDIIMTEFYVLYQIGDERKAHDIVVSIKNSRFAPHIGPVTFVENGKRKVSKENIMIAPLYIMSLAKIADTWLSAASARLNHFGIPSHSPKSTKHQLPWRNSATRVLGETEVRLYGSYVTEEFLAELKSQGSSPESHKHAYMNILKSENPSNIDRIIDREVLPYGDDKALEYISSIFACSGIKIEYSPDVSEYHDIYDKIDEDIEEDGEEF